MKRTIVVLVLAAFVVLGLAFVTLVGARSSPSRLREHSAMAPLEHFGGEGDRAAAPAQAEDTRMGIGGLGPGGGGAADSERTVGLLAKRSPPAAPKGDAFALKKSKDKAEEVALDGPSPTGSDEGGVTAPTRAWFPETFLFEPLVVTDAQGSATVPVRIPDRLTHWRVLALAHSRSGGQAGAVTQFQGTLPVYVDPVVPPFLIAGDQVRLPVQAVNTTDRELNPLLRVEAQGAALSSTGGPLRLPPLGSQVVHADLRTQRPGTVTLRARLGSEDAIERTIDVLPAGRPVQVSRGGTLAGPRSFELAGPDGALEGSEQVRLLVYPGALGVLRSELGAALHRGGVAEDAYLLLLAGRAPSLLRALGDDANPEAIRTLKLLGAQRALRHGRAPSVETATLLAEAASVNADSPVLSRLGERLAATVAARQRPDGTCQGADGWTLQRLLVTTAECAQSVRATEGFGGGKQRAGTFFARASGAFERNLGRVADGYTAAAILSTGLVSGPTKTKLKELVLAGIAARADGNKTLAVERGVVRADGLRPSELEATALAVLALEGEQDAPLADLGATLLGSYHPSYGWGDGRTNLVCLRAVLRLFRDPVPAGVRVQLERDGVMVAQGQLDAAQLKDVLTLHADASGSAGKHQWSVRSEPAVAGLGFSLTLQSYVPWTAEPPNGLDLEIATPGQASVGQPSTVSISATGPSGVPLKVRHALPAGVQADLPSLEALAATAKVSHFDTEDGAITLHVPARPPGQPFTATYRVVPTLAGTLQASASAISLLDDASKVRHVPPRTWVVR